MNDCKHSTTTITTVPIHSILETPENWKIYQNPEADDQLGTLVDAITANGVLEPVTISSDGYLLSGHRRLAAVKVAIKRGGSKHHNLWTIPAIVADIEVGPMSPAERTKILVAHNRGSRVKTTSELVAEAMAEVDPEAAIARAASRKAKVYGMSRTLTEGVEAATGSRRTNPLRHRGEFLDAVNTILGNTTRFPITQRAIHYRLLSMAPLMSKSKRGQRYGKTGNSKNDCSKLSKLLTDARSARLIDDSLINDGTRPDHCIETSSSVGEYVKEEVEGMFAGFFSNVHRDQDAYVEILCEKNTIFELLLNHVASPLRLPLTSGRGYVSYPVGCKLRDRFLKSGKDKFVIIYVSDHDPEGLDMPSSWMAYFKIDHGIDVEVRRAAVTRTQIEKYNLLPDAEAKPSGSRCKKYVEQHGTDVWELDSMDPDTLVKEVEGACLAWMDVEKLNAALKQEQEDDVRLARLAAAVGKLIPGLLKELEDQ